MPEPVVILGCGYTGTRVAAAFVGRGHVVIGTARHPLDIPSVESVHFDAASPRDLGFIPEGARILYSIPALDPDPAPAIIDALSDRRPARLVYLSTTSVYGAAAVVDEHTPPAPRTPSEYARVHAEQAVLAAPFSSMVLRPAAIYGPGRGVHVRMLEGTFRLAGEGLNYTSRIHVNDLAAIAVAAMLSPETGAWPVADLEPCRSREIAAYCARLLRVPMAPSADPASLHQTRRADRRVNGGKILRLLGVDLRYPSYRQGIPASVDPSAEPQIITRS